MFRPDRAHLFVRGKFPAPGGGLRTRDSVALVVARGDLRLIVPGKVQDEARDFILHGGVEATGGFNGAFEQFRP